MQLSSVCRHKIRLAIIGCGAITENFYLPNLLSLGIDKKRSILVDTNRDRLNYLTRILGFRLIATDYKQILRHYKVDGVIIATPHNQHYQITKYFLGQKIPVLCEKPLAETKTEVADLIRNSERLRVPILVNQTRRLFPSSQMVRKLLLERRIGRIISCEYIEGSKFNWPTVSGFYFRGDRGVLLDRGSHVIDLICWWLGKPKSIQYTDDSFGGCEADAEIKFMIGLCQCYVRLSYLANLTNCFTIRGTKGVINGEIYDPNRIFVKIFGTNGHKKIIMKPTNFIYSDFGRILLTNFVNVVSGCEPPLVSAKDVIESVETMEYCYRHRKRFVMPWM